MQSSARMKKIVNILEMSPEKLAPRVKQAREQLGLSTAELARQANVEFYSVTRVENENEDPGILTSLAVAEAAKIINFDSHVVDQDATRFAELLASDKRAAGVLFDEITTNYLSPSIAGECPTGIFSLNTSTRARGRFQIVETVALEDQIRKFKGDLFLILPRDLGNISKNCLKLSRRMGLEQADQNQDQLYWNHLATGRAVNVSSRRLAHSVEAVTALCKESGFMSPSSYLDIVWAAFMNHFHLERTHRSECKKHNVDEVGGFWQLIYDYIRMLRMVHLDDSRSGRPRRQFT